MKCLTIIKSNGNAYVDSREVAEMIGKRHDHLLRDIANYRKIIACGRLPKIGESDFFVESSYINTQAKEQPCYLIARKGCDLIANKLTGEKGVLFTAAYVTEFHRLDAAERERKAEEQNKPSLSDFNSAVRNVLNGMSRANTMPNGVMKFLRGVYNPLGIKVYDIEDARGYHSATDIAHILKISSLTGRPHGRAVSAIIEKLDVTDGHTIIVPYGLVGVNFRYDDYVKDAVLEWLIESGFPTAIQHNDFEYHIRYNRNRLLILNDKTDYESREDEDFYEDFDEDYDGEADYDSGEDFNYAEKLRFGGGFVRTCNFNNDHEFFNEYYSDLENKNEADFDYERLFED